MTVIRLSNIPEDEVAAKSSPYFLTKSSTFFCAPIHGIMQYYRNLVNAGHDWLNSKLMDFPLLINIIIVIIIIIITCCFVT